ncbi:MAG: pre-peptidase C-terminal domain-containing protein [Woeseiaceae bacterium]|nr:pre-peptidase C-terminal domain-containing protein [Woeseiaceae bacterium]
MADIRTILRRATAACALTALSATAIASGPLNQNPNDPDNVERWPNGGLNIPFNPDGAPGGDPNALALGPLTYLEAVAETEMAFARWQSIPTATATYSNNGPMPFDIDVTNYFPFVTNLFFGFNDSDGFSPIVYDQDGSIFVDLFGVSGVLGFASTDTRDAAGNPIEAVSFLNGGAILGGFPLVDFQAVIFHEFGHYSGLGHTVVNGQSVAFGDPSGPAPFNTYGFSPVNQVETMYPFALIGGGQGDPHADDIAFYSFLYPSADYFATSGTISGTVFGPNGETPLTGVNVIARNVDNPFEDAVSAISGDRGVTGAYTINGLTPGANYTVHVDGIIQGGFSTPPLQPLPGPEEFYNGGNESNNVDSPDDPGESVPVPAFAGTPTTDIDFIFNAPRPGDPLPLGLDDSLELFTPFPIKFCGQEYDSVFINSSGNITFGTGDPFGFIESEGALLGGPPRITGVWDDLNPLAGGFVTFDQTNNSFSIIFNEVPEFPATGANSFSITLYKAPGKGKAGSRFDITVGDITLSDGLVGYSCGGAVTSGFEIPTDLSELHGRIRTRGESAIYEVFSFFEPNDLAGRSVQFQGTRGFVDRFEPNNSPAEARNVRLPFDTIHRYSEIDPAGGDVDWYKFRARAGETIVAEVTGGNLDSVLGLYQLVDDGAGGVTAIEIAFDDDGGSGLLSRIIAPVSETGTYAVAVSTFPDFGLTGNGFSSGRYVLSVQAIEGEILSLGDDNFVEIPLEFEFPFQGEVYTSIFVNSNGNLTFGAGDTDFSESVSELLAEQPRIAPLWDDLSPNQGGLVYYCNDSGGFVLTFQDVPEFFASTGNTFEVTLDPLGYIYVSYGEINATDGLVGISEGNFAADPGPTDLSEATSLSADGTTYELFNFSNTNDLSWKLLIYTPEH